MCGINFIADASSCIHDDTILSMNASILYRGPDYSGHFVHQGSHTKQLFGCNRLKIIDTENGNQPFSSKDGQYVLCFNGEIHNFQELRTDLKKVGHSFETTSDTEVLLCHLIEHGIEGLHVLDGMFAFSFTDLKSNTTIIARDRFGIKPLYYSETKDQLILSSEIRGVLASGVIKKELNENQISYYLKYRYASPPETFYQNIFEIQPGEYRVYSGSKLQKSGFIRDGHSQKTDLSVEEILTSSLKRQLISDSKIGLLLSGGIDSSLLLALSNELGTKLPCFTIGSSQQKNDDLVFAEKISRHFGVSQQVYEVTSQSLLNDFQEYISITDQPIGDGAGYLTWKMSGLASESVKVLLSGAGADELFGGYNRHYAFNYYLNKIWRKDLKRKGLKVVSGILPEGKSGGKLRHFNMFTNKIDKDPSITFNNFIGLRFPAELTGRVPGKVHFQTHNKQGLLHEALRHDLENYLVHDVLKITDNYSMRNGVEVRVPFLCNDMLSYFSNASHEVQADKKHQLVSILDKYVPEEFTQREKQGFGMPFGHWVRNKELPAITELLHNKKCAIYKFIDFQQSQALIEKHISGKRDYSNELWSLCTLAHWLENEFN